MNFLEHISEIPSKSWSPTISCLCPLFPTELLVSKSGRKFHLDADDFLLNFRLKFSNSQFFLEFYTRKKLGKQMQDEIDHERVHWISRSTRKDSHVCSFKVKLSFSEVDEFENVSVKKNVTYVMHLADRLEAGISVRKKYFGNNKITGIPFDIFWLVFLSRRIGILDICTKKRLEN